MRRSGAGDFSNRIVIEQNTPARAASGDFTDSWSSYIGCWASIQPATARELSIAQHLAAETNYVVKLRRYHPGITTAMRVHYSDPKTGTARYFDIKGAVNPMERRDQLWLYCREQA